MFLLLSFFPESFTKERQHKRTAFIVWACGCRYIIDSLTFLVIMCSIDNVKLWISKLHFRSLLQPFIQPKDLHLITELCAFCSVVCSESILDISLLSFRAKNQSVSTCFGKLLISLSIQLQILNNVSYRLANDSDRQLPRQYYQNKSILDCC